MRIYCINDPRFVTGDWIRACRDLDPSFRLKKNSEIIDCSLPDLPTRTLILLPSHEPLPENLENSAKNLGAEIHHFDQPEESFELILSLIKLEVRRAHLLDSRPEKRVGVLWWIILFGLLYIQINAVLRYFDVNWQLPFFDFRSVIYREYLQIHIPTAGGILFTLLALRLRKPNRQLFLRRQVIPAAIILTIVMMIQLTFSILFFRHGFIVQRESHIHSEGLGMLFNFEVFSFQRFVIEDEWRYMQSAGQSPNVWAFYQPWAIIGMQGYAIWTILRWLFRALPSYFSSLRSPH